LHGLPIEWKIEESYRKKGQNKDDVPVSGLPRRVPEVRRALVGVQRDEFQRLGVTGNWAELTARWITSEAAIAGEVSEVPDERTRSTRAQSPSCGRWSRKPRLPKRRSSTTHKSHTIWVKFPLWPLAEENDIFHRKADVVIWTTTPWTNPQNRASVFNPEIGYGLYEVYGRPEECWARIGDRYIVADTLADAVFRAGAALAARLRAGGLPMSRPRSGGDDPGPPPFVWWKARAGEWDFDVPCCRGPCDRGRRHERLSVQHGTPSCHGAERLEIGKSTAFP
jgi:isoleucyl-tRNA synthetase